MTIDRVVAVEVAPDGVRGITVVDNPPRVVSFAETDISPEVSASLAVAEVVQALHSFERPSPTSAIQDHPPVTPDIEQLPVVVSAQIEASTMGPVDGVAHAAKTKAAEIDGPVRWTTWNGHGILVNAHEVDRVVQTFKDAGITVQRIDLAEAAALSVLTKPTLPGTKPSVRGCDIPSNLLGRHTDLNATTLAPTIGTALALFDGTADGDLRPDVAETASPDGGPLDRWAIEPRPAPVDFSAPTADSPNRRLQLAVLAMTLVTMILILLLVST